MYIRVAIFCTSLITENCTLSISGYICTKLHLRGGILPVARLDCIAKH